MHIKLPQSAYTAVLIIDHMHQPSYRQSPRNSWFSECAAKLRCAYLILLMHLLVEKVEKNLTIVEPRLSHVIPLAFCIASKLPVCACASGRSHTPQ